MEEEEEKGGADWRPGNEEGRNLRDSRKTHPASMTDLFPTFFSVAKTLNANRFGFKEYGNGIFRIQNK